MRYILLPFLLFLIGCSEPEPIEISEAVIVFDRKSNGAVTGQANSQALSRQQIQFVQIWLNTNRNGWTSHHPMAPLLPYWCMSLKNASDKTIGLCRYGKKLVLRGRGAEIEHPLSDGDSAAFLKNIETAER